MSSYADCRIIRCRVMRILLYLIYSRLHITRHAREPKNMSSYAKEKQCKSDFWEPKNMSSYPMSSYANSTVMIDPGCVSKLTKKQCEHGPLNARRKPPFFKK